MSRPLFEQTQQRQIAANRYLTKDTRQRPFASGWVYPLNAGDCGLPEFDPYPLGDGSEYGYVETWTPCLVNNFEQVDPDAAENLEVFGFRMHHDGSLEFKGHLNIENANSGDVAFTLPGMNNLEPDYVELLQRDQYFESVVFNTGTVEFTIALLWVSELNGEVVITWPAVV